MSSCRATNAKASGAALGTYEAEDAAGALDAMAREAGYRDAADARKRSGDDGAHLVVTEVDVSRVRRSDRRIDLWEDNSGGLLIVDRECGIGFYGFERGQNEKRLRAAGRAEFTLVSDAPSENFDELHEGSAYERMTSADVESLYARAGETDQAVMVASYENGDITIWPGRSIGLSARWYLDGAGGVS